MAEILDIEKIGELGKLDIINLKLILKELLADLLAEQKQTEQFKVDITAMLELLYMKGIISKEEFEDLRDKLNSLLNKDKIDDSLDTGIPESEIEQIKRRSNFKGFFSSYEELITKYPIEECKHGFFAYVKDFNADLYNENKIEEYVFDITYNKWTSGTDKTVLINVYIRDDEEETGRTTGEPLEQDLLQYTAKYKRWINKTHEEADIARKSNLDSHIEKQVLVRKDEAGSDDGSIKDNGRLIVHTNFPAEQNHPLHINKVTLQKILDEIDTDYYTKLEIGTEIDELGIEKIVITGEDIDEYGNAIRRNITNQVAKTILKNLYDKLFDTFNIEIDEETKRMSKLNEGSPRDHVPRTITTVNVDKIIEYINKDYNNAFTIDNKETNNYETILRRVLNSYNEFNLSDDISQDVIKRLLYLNSNKELWDRYTNIIETEKNKNLTPEVFNELLDLIHYLYISKDFIRDEILERDIIFNGDKTFNGNINFNGDQLNVNNQDGIVNIKPNTNFYNDVNIKGNLTVEGTTTNVNSDNLNIEDNIIVLNKGETGEGVTKGSSGILIDRGTSDNLFFGFDEYKNRIVTGIVPDESYAEISKLNEVAVLNKNIDINKPLVYNEDIGLLENSDFIKTDIDGATSFTENIPNHNFKLLDPVRYNSNNELELCSMNSYEECEVIGIVSRVTKDTVQVVVNGFIPCELDIPSGTVLFLLDGEIGRKGVWLLQRKVGIKVPNGIIVDIQKNSEKEEADEIKYEQVMHRVLEPMTELIIPDNGMRLTFNSKVFIDGILQVEGVHYKVIYTDNTIRLLTPYEDRVDLLIITCIAFGNTENEYVTDQEVDDIFGNKPDPRPPFEDTEYLKDYEVDRIFGIMSSEGPGLPVRPDEAEWCTNEEVDDIFSARALYSKYNLLEQSLKKDIFVEGNYVYFFSKERYLEICDFVEIDKEGKINKINRNTQNIIGIIQSIKIYDNGLIEYQINNSKIVPYSDIKLNEYSRRYNTDINFGDCLYISDKINKFSGNKICSFSNVAMFLEYEKLNKKELEKEDKIIILEQNNFYLIKTDKMSINTLDLFEKDSSNFCKLNLINNSYLMEKNLYYDIQIGKKIFNLYRLDDNFVIEPIRNLTTNSKLKFKKIKNNNLIPI